MPTETSAQEQARLQRAKAMRLRSDHHKAEMRGVLLISLVLIIRIESENQQEEVVLLEREFILAGSGLAHLVTALEELAYHGWRGSTPCALTVEMEDGRRYTLRPGPRFLKSEATPRPSANGRARIPIIATVK